jgi:MFS transporter, OFA family, oxalate/formate antiporter
MQNNPDREITSLLGMPLEKGRWVLIVSGLVINLCLGTIYSWSVFVNPLTDYFSTNLGQSVTANEVLMPFSLFLSVFAITMALIGTYVERRGPREVTITGCILTGVGWLLASMVTSITMLSVLFGVIGGIGVGIVYGATIAIAARWFPDRRGLAVGISVFGVGFSTFITANLAGYFISAYGVMNTFRIFGIGIILITVPLAIPLTFPPMGWKPAAWTPPDPQKGEHVTCERTRSEMVKSPAFYGLWICFFIGSMAGLMAISISQPVGTELIYIAAGLATALVGFFAIFNGCGRPVFGYLTDRLNPGKTAMISFVLIAFASFLMWQVPVFLGYIIAFAVLWGCLGGWLAIAPTATASYFGTVDYPRCYGIVFLAYGAGQSPALSLPGSSGPRRGPT